MREPRLERSNRGVTPLGPIQSRDDKPKDEARIAARSEMGLSLEGEPDNSCRIISEQWEPFSRGTVGAARSWSWSYRLRKYFAPMSSSLNPNISSAPPRIDPRRLPDLVRPSSAPPSLTSRRLFQTLHSHFLPLFSNALAIRLVTF